LYGGQCGVAVFFAATAWVTADPRFRELALGALSPVLSALRECPENVVEEAGIGGATGRASIAYGLVTCARLPRGPGLVRAAYALARLSVVTERADFLAAAEEGIAYEAAIFRPDEANWPDLQPSPPGASAPVRVISSWCQGAAGVGLGRLAGLGVLDSAQVRA